MRPQRAGAPRRECGAAGTSWGRSRIEDSRYDRDDVLARVDLAALVGEVAGPGRREGTRWRFRCPFHEDRTPSLDVAEVDGVELWKCRAGCGGGSAIDFVMLDQRVEFVEALQRLGERYGGVPQSPSPARAPQRSRTPWRPAEDKARPVEGDEAEAALSGFLADRGWSRWAADEFGLSVVRDRAGHLRVRFLAWFGESIWWQQDRAIAPGVEPRWLAPTGGAALPFGFHRLGLLDELAAAGDLWEHGRDVWVTEGSSDAVALVDGLGPSCPTVAAGLPGSAMRGALEILAPVVAGLSVFVLVDGDEAGERHRAMIGEALEGVAAEVVHVRIPLDGGDVDDWRRAAGDDFAEQVIEATMAALAGCGR